MSFLDYKSGIINKLKSIGLSFERYKSIDFGELMEFRSNLIYLKISCFYNKKQQYSFYINKVEPEQYREPIKNLLISDTLFDLELSEEKEVIQPDFWAGSDESGKGDYFGPLVVVCFACYQKDIHKLQLLGIRDSKLLSDAKICQLAEKLLIDYHSFYQYIILMPEQYNPEYTRFSQSKPGLNEMLSYLHSRVIFDLYQKHEFQLAIIDKFANEKLIHSYIQKVCQVPLKIINQAENDPAVAAASIIARYLYVKKMEELSEKYKINLLKGASEKVKQLRNSLDPNILPFVAKMHFK